VLRAYRMAQRWILPGDNRPLGARTLAIFRFVTEHADAGCGHLPWRGLLENWNRMHPEWRCEDIRRLARDFGRAEKCAAASE